MYQISCEKYDNSLENGCSAASWNVFQVIDVSWYFLWLFEGIITVQQCPYIAHARRNRGETQRFRYTLTYEFLAHSSVAASLKLQSQLTGFRLICRSLGVPEQNTEEKQRQYHPQLFTPVIVRFCSQQRDLKILQLWRLTCECSMRMHLDASTLLGRTKSRSLFFAELSGNKINQISAEERLDWPA